MRVPTVYAHPNPSSFCHAVLDRFTQGLKDAGHTSDVVVYRLTAGLLAAIAVLTALTGACASADARERAWDGSRSFNVCGCGGGDDGA